MTAVDRDIDRLRNLAGLRCDVREIDLESGDLDSVTARLKQLREEIGFDGILAELNCGGLIPHARVLNAIRLLCREVMPRFNQGSGGL